MTEWIVTSSALLALVIGLRYLCQGKLRKKLQYSLWLLVLLRLLLPVSLGSTSVSIANVVGEAPGVAPTLATEQGESDRVLLPKEGAPVPHEPVPEAPQSFQVSLPLMWMSGSILVGLWFFLVNLRFWHTLRRTRQPYKVDCPRPVYVCDNLATPCLFGLVRPAIYLTPAVTQDQVLLRHTLAHELTHYRHGDHVWSLLRGVCLALHWYNPLVWWGAVLSCQDSELACDEGTIRTLGQEQRLSYGQTLLDMTCQTPGNVLLTATSMSGNFRALKARISAIAKGGKMPKYLLFAVVAIALVIAVCTFTGSTVKSGPMTQAELNRYSIYQVTWADGSQDATIDDILALSTEVTEDTIQNRRLTTVTTYESDTLADFLPQCKRLTNVERIYHDDFTELAQVYIYYETDQLEISLSYNWEGLTSQLVYDKKTDIVYDMGTVSRTVGFRQIDIEEDQSQIAPPVSLGDVTALVATAHSITVEEAAKTLPDANGAEDFIVYEETIAVSDTIKPKLYIIFTGKQVGGQWYLDHLYHVTMSNTIPFGGHVSTFQQGNTAFQYTVNGSFYETGTTDWSRSLAYGRTDAMTIIGTLSQNSPEETGTYCFQEKTLSILKDAPAKLPLR